jgi:large subunit ribosomal protein L10
MTPTPKAHVSEEKKGVVSELNNLIKNKRTILVASIKDIPASQFQTISKKLRGTAIVKVPKKNLIFRSLDSSSNEVVKQLKTKIVGNVAILFSDIDSFELGATLIQNKSSVKAKPGQEAPEDIVVEAGPTDLLPGPAISELGALGIQLQIDKGKITIKESKVIAKKGEKISAGAADVMSKLGIKPFLVGFTPLAAFDSQDNKLYTEINIDKEGTVEELKSLFGKALAFAVEVSYTTKDTISFLLQKAERNVKALESFTGKVEEIEENTPEENKPEGEEK